MGGANSNPKCESHMQNLCCLTLPLGALIRNVGLSESLIRLRFNRTHATELRNFKMFTQVNIFMSELYFFEQLIKHMYSVSM